MRSTGGACPRPRSSPRSPRCWCCSTRCSPRTAWSEIARLGLIRCILEFAAGTAVCALWLRWRAAWLEPALIAATLAAILLAGWIAGALPETLAVPAAFAAALLALALGAGRRGNPLDAAPLHWLGEISYATYLGHYLLWFAFKLAFVQDARAVPWPLIALYLALVLASSALLYHRVERPAQKWVNGLKLPSRLREGSWNEAAPPRIGKADAASRDRLHR